MNKPFVFVGSGLGYLWLLIWTTVVSIITVGLFFPWAYSAQQRWICANTYVEGRRLRFDGTGLGFFFQWLVIMLLTAVTLALCSWAIASLNAGRPVIQFLMIESNCLL